MKWIFYVVVFIYMGYRAVYGTKLKEVASTVVDPVNYGEYETYLPPNSHKSISCKYTNKNQKVEWLDPAGNIIPLSTTKRIATQKHQGPLVRGERIYSLVLTFTDTQVADTGEYECRSGDMSKTVSLCVIGPSDFVDTPTEVTMDEGRSFTLSCQARGQPEPRLVWLRNGEEITDDSDGSKYQVMTKYNSQGFEGLLTITSLAPEDSGDYTCKAIQEHPDIEDCNLTRFMNISVIVNYAPVFEDGNATIIYGKHNESIDFVCNAGGHPMPTYRWFHALDDDTVYEYAKDKINFSEDKSEATFTTVANALTFGQTYICEAKNEHGEAKKMFVLLKVEKPKRPNEVHVYNSSISHIELNITWSEPVLFPIDYFEIQHLPVGAKGRLPKETDWKKADTFNFKIEELDDEDVGVIKLTELESETDYWVRLRVGNELGLSPWTSPIVASTDAVEDESIKEFATEVKKMLDEIESEDNEDDDSSNDAMFYGIFFAGGIIVLTFGCVIIMKLV